jgi:hypothetical protein
MPHRVTAIGLTLAPELGSWSTSMFSVTAAVARQNGLCAQPKGSLFGASTHVAIDKSNTKHNLSHD